MDKFSELKRLAEKSPVQRFEPFIGRAGGRGTQAIFNADTKGEVITWSGFDSSDVTSRTGREAIARFVAAVDPETVLAMLAELEAKDKRIAELEAIRADSSLVLKEIGNELGCNPDNESIMMAIDALKERLATPVRLPDVLFIKVSGSAVPVMHAERVKERLRAAGVKIEGDE
jgi:hypothetical protein